MSNYITIESGYYEPFKENETDPELKPWADKYYEIIGEINEALLENEKRYEKRYEHLNKLSDRIISLRDVKDEMFKEKCLQYNSNLKEIDDSLHRISMKYEEDENRYYEEGWGTLAVSNMIDELKVNNGDNVIENRLEKQKSSILEEVKNKTREQLLQTSFKNEMNSVFEDDEIGFFMDLHYYFKEEKEQDLSLWRYDHIENLFYSEEYIEEHLEKRDSTFSSRLSELLEELRECLLHRSWIGEKSILINESNIVNVEYVVEWVHNDDAIHTFQIGTGEVENENNCNRYDSGTRGCLEFRTGAWTIRVLELDRCQLFQEVNCFINQIKPSEIMQCYLAKFVDIFTRCSIVDAYKDFQSNNIEKIIKDKIKCGEIKTFNISVNTDFYCQYH